MAAPRGRAAVAAVRSRVGLEAMRRPLATVIIPVLNESKIIERALLPLQPWRPLVEVVVVDGGSTDETLALAGDLCDQALSAKRGRAAQMNAGAEAAKGIYLLFLHSDSWLTITAQELSRVLDDRPRWGFFRARLSGRSWPLKMIAWFMNRRSSITRIATGDQALFIHGELFRRLGGFADIPIMEDIELCTRLRRLHAPTVVRQAVVTSSRRWEEKGILRTVLTMWRLRLAYWIGVSPDKLVRQYYG